MDLLQMHESNAITDIGSHHHLFNLLKYEYYTLFTGKCQLDRDLAKLYQVETKVLNQAVKRNADRFPDYYRFQLTHAEVENLRSQIVTTNSNYYNDSSNSWDISGLNNIISSMSRSLPYAFTEQGVAMLSAVLKSKAAIVTSIKIKDLLSRGHRCAIWVKSVLAFMKWQIVSG